MNKKQLQIPLIFVGLLILNLINQSIYKRIDLTADQRYTLSETTEHILTTVAQPLFITVYLEGDFPAEFQRLQVETIQFLEELSAENGNIIINLENPDDQREALVKKGMIPSQLTVEEDGKLSEAIIFPWAEVQYLEKRKIVHLLPEVVLNSQEDQFQKAIENLEYLFSSAIKEVTQTQQKKIAVLTGNGQLEDIYMYSFLSEISKKYRLVKFTLDSVKANPKSTLQKLNQYDLAILAKPTEAFTEEEKFTIDQFITNGGKTLWMIDKVQADQDSLMATGKMLAYPRDLNLTDQLFFYGVRINGSLVKDLYASKIALVTGRIGNQSQYQNLDWFYHPLVGGNPDHPITKNTPPIRLQFASPMDALENDLVKTPLLMSSPLTQTVGTPNFIELQSIAEEPTEAAYAGGNQLFGLLLEGKFTSAYKNRIKPYETEYYKEVSTENKMIVISDGDIAKNQILKGQPVDLNRDKWTNETFGNKNFLMNAVDYLLDDTGLIQLRNKKLQVRILDQQKAYQERSYWQFINVVLPLVLLAIFGVLFHYFRKRSYLR